VQFGLAGVVLYLEAKTAWGPPEPKGPVEKKGGDRKGGKCDGKERCKFGNWVAGTLGNGELERVPGETAYLKQGELASSGPQWEGPALGGGDGESRRMGTHLGRGVKEKI